MNIGISTISNDLIAEYGLKTAFLISKLPNICSYYRPSIEEIKGQIRCPFHGLDVKLDEKNLIYEPFSVLKLEDECMGEFTADQVIEILHFIEEHDVIKFLGDKISSGYFTFGFVAQKYKPKIKENRNKIKDKTIYLIMDKILNKLKIGISKNVKGRLQQLQIATPNKLELLGKIKHCSYEDEFELQKKFKDFNVRSEWFDYDKSIVDYFKNKNK